MNLLGPHLDTLQRALDVRSARHTKLAHNLANIDTPGYRPLDVDFEQSLANAIDDHDATPSGVGPRGAVVETRAPEAAPTPDGNTVDLDWTTTTMAENGAMYTATTRIAQKHLALMRYVASDGLS